MGDLVLTVDLGGTQMRAALVDADGTVVTRRLRATPRGDTCPDALLALAGDLVADPAVATAVIGVPGRIDHHRGVLLHAPNLPDTWISSLREDHLADRLGVAISLANDADLATVGEARFGAGRGHDDLVYVTISTGVGAGVMIGGRLLQGRRSLAELGHTTVDLHAARQGRPASVEDRASGTALGRAAAGLGLPSDGAELAELVRQGHEGAQEVWDEVVGVAAVAIVNAVHLFSPEVVVLGGGMGRDPAVLGPVTAAVDRDGPADADLPTLVRTAELGDDAGLVGGAGWADATGMRP
jgi:glucokinase